MTARGQGLDLANPFYSANQLPTRTELRPKDRVCRAIRFLDVDRIPLFEQEIATNVASEILGREAETGGGGIGWRNIAEALYKGERDSLVARIAKDLTELTLQLGLDGVCPPLVGTSGAKRKFDDNSYYYEDDDTETWSVVRYQPDTKEYQAVDSSLRREGLKALERAAEKLADKDPEVEEESFDVMDAVVDSIGGEVAIVGASVMGIPIEAAWLVASVRRPDLVSTVLDWQVKRHNSLAKLCKKHGADFILGGGDLAGKSGPVYPPSTFESLVLPRLRSIVEKCHDLGLPYFFRTDGNVWPIAEQLFLSSGVDGYGEIDISAGMRMGEVRAKFPRLLLWGGVDCARTLVYGSEEDIRGEAARSILESAPGRGYLFGSSNTIHPNVPASNFLAMLKAARAFGSCPIDRERLRNSLVT